jgi:hypothetical protein
MRKLANLFFDERTDFDSRTDLLRVWLRVNHSSSQLFRAIVEKLVQRSFRASISSTPNHERRVDHDARQPSGERGPALKRLQPRERPAKAILHGVLRILSVAQDGERNSAELAGVAREYLFVSVRISVNRLLNEDRALVDGRGRSYSVGTWQR